MHTKFIADIGSNHNGNIERAKDIISLAKECGFWGVKFQAFKAEKLFAEGHIPKHLDKNEIPLSWFYPLKFFCKDIDIAFGCTPFDVHTAEVISHYLDFIKISSFDILRHDLIKFCNDYCYDNDLPLIVSTGEATYQEIESALSVCVKNHRFTLLHCVSEYPVKNIYKCNLNKIKRLKELYHVNSGWSDHTVNAGVILQSIQLGADYIEMHFDLDDRMGAESYHGHVWDSKQMKEVLSIARDMQECMKEYEVHDDAKRGRRADPVDGLRPMREIR